MATSPSSNSDKPVTIAVGMGRLTDGLWQIPRWLDLLTACIMDTYKREGQAFELGLEGFEPPTKRL